MSMPNGCEGIWIQLGDGGREGRFGFLGRGCSRRCGCILTVGYCIEAHGVVGRGMCGRRGSCRVRCHGGRAIMREGRGLSR